MQIKNILRNIGALCAFLVLTVVVLNIINSAALQFGVNLLPREFSALFIQIPYLNWSISCYLTACAAWLIWRKKDSFFAPSLRWYYAQLLFNALAAVILYFQSAPLVILFLALCIACALQTTRLFYRENRIAALLMIPYTLIICNNLMSYLYPFIMSM